MGHFLLLVGMMADEVGVLALHLEDHHVDGLMWGELIIGKRVSDENNDLL